MERKKVYFYADEFVDKKTGRKSLVFCGQNGMWGHWAGGGPDKVNFVLEKLVKKRGRKTGVHIYQAFNDALLEVSKESNGTRKFPKGVLVLFKKENVDSVSEDVRDVNEVDETIHKREQRHQKSGKDEKKTSSSTKI